MASFLQKLRTGKTSNTVLAVAKEKLQFRDAQDPRILFKVSDRARRISLRVNSADREVIVIVPGEKAISKARRFAAEHTDWINVQLENLPPAQPFIPGGQVMMRGALYQLVSPEGRGRPKLNHIRKVINVPSPDAESFSGRVRRFMIREAREELEAATHHYADILGKRVGYSWRLIAAPEFVLEYVAAHECAHLVHADHSENFWNVCREIYPEMKAAKSWLRKNGPLLHAVGAEF